MLIESTYSDKIPRITGWVYSVTEFRDYVQDAIGYVRGYGYHGPPEYGKFLILDRPPFNIYRTYVANVGDATLQLDRDKALENLISIHHTHKSSDNHRVSPIMQAPKEFYFTSQHITEQRWRSSIVKVAIEKRRLRIDPEISSYEAQRKAMEEAHAD